MQESYFEEKKAIDLQKNGEERDKTEPITLFIGGFPPQTQEGKKKIVNNLEDIRKYFKNLNGLEVVKIVKGESGEVKGFGYLKFSNSEEATKAIGVHKIFGKMVTLIFQRLYIKSLFSQIFTKNRNFPKDSKN